MNERTLSAELRRNVFTLGRCYKLSDRFTTGIPDFCLHFGGVSSWWEVKFMRTPNVSELTKQPNWSAQLLELMLLSKHAHAVYLIFTRYDDARKLQASIWHPHVLSAALTHSADCFKRLQPCSPAAPPTALISSYVEFGRVIVAKRELPTLVHALLHSRCLRQCDVAKCIKSIQAD